MGIRSKSRTGFALRGAAPRGFAFALSVAVVGFGLIVGGQSAAFASAGCTALNGSFIGGVTTGSTSGTGFSAGEVITLTVTAAGGADTLGLYDNTNFNVLLLSNGVVGTRTFTVPANTAANFIISGTRLNAGSSFTWSCAAGSSGGGTDSQKLTSVQTQGSTIAANTSAAATTGAVNQAIDQAFTSEAPVGAQGPGVSTSSTGSSGSPQSINWTGPSGGLTPSFGSSGSTSPVKYMTESEYIALRTRTLGLSPGDPRLDEERNLYKMMIANGYAFVAQEGSPGYTVVRPSVSQFAPEARSDVARRADEAFAALGYAGGMPVKARRTTFGFTPEWSVWSSVAGAGFQQSDSSASKGTQINATAGLSYKLRENAVVGVYAGFENFKYDFDTLAGSLKGNGGSIGTYAGWQLTPTLRWKGMVGWTGVSYDGSAGTASGSFTGSRWLFSTSLTGSYRVAAFTVEPSASVFALTEHQTGYTDSLSVAHDARDFSTGRLSLGGKVIAPPQMIAGLTPYVGLYGDWGFMSDSAVPADISSRGLGGGWSARVTSGVIMPVFAKGTLALGGEYGGIGGEYKTWTGSARLSLPF